MERNASPTVEKTCPTCGRSTREWTEFALSGDELRRVGQNAVNLIHTILDERQRLRQQDRAERERDA